MTQHFAQAPHLDGSLLLRELNHRVNNELTSALCRISAKAAQSNDAAVKAALLDVVDLLHQCADVHRALRMPDQGRLTDAAAYLQHLCLSITTFRLDRSAIRVLVSLDDLQLEGERCWKLGLIVSELLTNVSRHAQFGDRRPDVRLELRRSGNVVKCRVFDNGTIPDAIRRGRGLTIVGALAGSLGGRLQTSRAAEGTSVLLVFPLSGAEQRVAGVAHRVLSKRRKMRAHRASRPGLDESPDGRPHLPPI